MSDLTSYHLFIVMMSTLLVFVVTLFAYETYGLLAAAISGLTIATYPLFFAESHFNIKDPPETAFYGLTIYFFWKAVSSSKGSWRWLLASFIFFGLGLGTKFNILFLPFIILPYLVFKYADVLKKGPAYVLKQIKLIPTPFKLTLLLGPILALAIFIFTWPYLWSDPLGNFQNILDYYQSIGTTASSGPFMVKGINFYPVIWILYTTSPWVLILLVIGVISIFIEAKKRKDVGILWLLWFLIPVGRVMAPGSSIYGGVRQIMEYIPAVALISGLGAKKLIDMLLNANQTFFIKKGAYLIFIPFIIHVFILSSIHPNENVYFNSLIGGLSGAKKAGITSAGNSFGNAYLQGINWLNENAEKDAKLALVQGTGQNVPTFLLRSDISFSNGYWSGIRGEGEYLMELNIEESSWAYPYAWEYVSNFLDPVFESRVQDVVLVTVWKNDSKNTFPDKRYKEVRAIFDAKIDDNIVTIDLREQKVISMVSLSFFKGYNCDSLAGVVETANDQDSWTRERDIFPSEQLSYKREDGKIVYFFAGRETRFIRFIFNDKDNCKLTKPRVEILELK